MTMKFKATLKKGDGTEEHRIIDAASRFAVYEQAEKEGYAVTALEEGSGFALPSWTKVSIGSGVSVDKKITFAKSLAAMLGAGLTLARALAVTERQASSKRMREIATELGENVKKGSTFHEALAAHPNVFSKLFVAMAKAGEESGTLANSLTIVVGLVVLLKAPAGSAGFTALLLRVPVVGLLVRETMSARAARSLSSLLSSGVEMLLALSITEEVVGTRAFA